MRVLHVSTWNARCGIATYCANLVQSLDELGVKNDVFPLAPHQWPTYLPKDVEKLVSNLAKKAREFDLVHIQHEHGLFGASLGMSYSTAQYGRVLNALRAVNTPVVTTFHTEVAPVNHRRTKLRDCFRDWFRHHKWRARIAKHFGVRVGMNRAIVHSSQTRLAFAQAGLPVNAIHVIRHACLPKKEYTVERNDARKRLGYSAHEVWLTMFGFVGAYKGHDLAVQTLKLLPQNFRLMICGGSHPESRDGFLCELMKLIKSAGLTGRVSITGWLPTDVAELYYAATDICLAPYRLSSNLSASGAITWALSSGRPIVASNIEAFQDIQREAECMFMAAPEALHELAWAIQVLNKDPQQQARLVHAANRYIQQYSWSRTAEETLSLYEDIVGNRAALTLPLRMAA
jgi:glycosyltransferase involved in cell wall biosynthesis